MSKADNKPVLALNQADVSAVIDYIYQHVRTSPNGRGYKVWKKMLDFQTGNVKVPEKKQPKKKAKPKDPQAYFF